MLEDARVMVEVLACSAEGTTWGMTSFDVDGAARVAQALAVLRAARARNLDGRETEAREVRIGSMAFEPPPLRLRFEGRKPDGQPVVEHALLFAHGSRVFHAAALGGAPSNDALETFFDSVEASR